MTKSVMISGLPMPITGQGRVQGVTADATAGGNRMALTIGTNIKAVMITSDQDCYFRLGNNVVTVTAAAGDPATDGTVCRAGAYVFLKVNPGQNIAFIQKDTSGLVNITELP